MIQTITELYMDGVKVTNLDTADLERNREFMDKHYIDKEERTDIPTTKNFTFSIGGTLNIEDEAHKMLLFDFPKEVINFDYYIGEKSNNIGFSMPVYIESIAPTHSGEGTVDFSATFRAAGPIVPII